MELQEILAPREELLQRIYDATEVAITYGNAPDAEVQQWTIDQILRIVGGSAEAYIDLRKNMSDQGLDWSEGVAPLGY